ncbi:MAG: hypothetical protein JXM68_04975, partial [Sedimentisphaerales bacterium]|nr:hypothetical protein [Sedimentisphaerales bacterium]
LTPVMPGLDSTAVAFEAGYRKGRRVARVWQVCSGGMALLLVLLSIYTMLGTGRRFAPAVDNNLVQFASYHNNAGPVELPVKKLNENSYILLRNKVLEHGVDALPESSGQKGRVLTVRDMLQS